MTSERASKQPTPIGKAGIGPKAVPAPRHLTAASRRFWDSIVQEYVLEPHHRELLRLCCESLDRASEARRAIAEHGPYIEGRFGMKAHPALGVERDSAIRSSRLLRELGLDLSPETPASRPPTRWR